MNFFNTESLRKVMGDGKERLLEGQPIPDTLRFFPVSEREGDTVTAYRDGQF
ncbi:hypothetical protein [Methanolobus sp. ZRKC5]|uniref:hypothetical protein n=1 Tax=Methanolobus sp. ZRKC5 TaxID=3136295 RepID=UPI00313C8711